MPTLQIISSALDWLRSLEEPRAEVRDVLCHPELAGMSPRQLADLPFPRGTEGRPRGAAGGKLELRRCA